MESHRVLSEEYLQFLEKLYLPAESEEECEQNVKEAVAILAPGIRLGKVEVLMESPASKLRTSEEHRRMILFDQGEDVGRDVCALRFGLPDSGNVCIYLYPAGQTPFSEEERRTQSLIGKQIFSQFGRVMMQRVLTHVINTDMATGVANQKSFMQFVVSLMRQQRLAQYHVFFFNIHNFKYVNKVFPYAEGDVVLRKYAKYVDE